jgi:hypothetical protein
MTDPDKERTAKDLIRRAVAKFMDSVVLGEELAEAVGAEQEFSSLLCTQLIDLAASCLATTTNVPADVAERMFGELFRCYRKEASAREASPDPQSPAA